MRTRTFWLLVITFGIASVGVTGLNLHVYPYVTDLGHPPLVAATVMSVIASMQPFSPLAWGFFAEQSMFGSPPCSYLLFKGSVLAWAC